MANKIVNTKLLHFPYKVKLRLLPKSRSFLANQKARNAIVEAENLLIIYIIELKRVLNWVYFGGSYNGSF